MTATHDNASHDTMPEHVDKQVEVIGTSRVSIEDAVRNAIKRTSETSDHLRRLEITNICSWVDGPKPPHWQVRLKLGFQLDD